MGCTMRVIQDLYTSSPSRPRAPKVAPTTRLGLRSFADLGGNVAKPIL
jgi:hypothetical protein